MLRLTSHFLEEGSFSSPRQQGVHSAPSWGCPGANALTREHTHLRVYVYTHTHIIIIVAVVIVVIFVIVVVVIIIVVVFVPIYGY